MTCQKHSKYIAMGNLRDYIKNNKDILVPGETFITVNQYGYDKGIYVYFYKPEDENPFWIKIDTNQVWRDIFDTMTLEQKVDFLIEDYIRRNAR